MIDTGINIEPLRQDLKIFKNERQKDGAPSWLIYDPLKKNYYQINALEFLIISNWHLLDPEKIILKISYIYYLNFQIKDKLKKSVLK